MLAFKRRGPLAHAPGANRVRGCGPGGAALRGGRRGLHAVRSMAGDQGKKTRRLFAAIPFLHKNDHITKTGSGQTERANHS